MNENLSPDQFGPEFNPVDTGNKRLDVMNIRSKFDDVDRTRRNATGEPMYPNARTLEGSTRPFSMSRFQRDWVPQSVN